MKRAWDMTDVHALIEGAVTEMHFNGVFLEPNGAVMRAYLGSTVGGGLIEDHRDDEEWWEMLDKVAEENGCYICGGPDPTDRFIEKSFDVVNILTEDGEYFRQARLTKITPDGEVSFQCNGHDVCIDESEIGVVVPVEEDNDE